MFDRLTLRMALMVVLNSLLVLYVIDRCFFKHGLLFERLGSCFVYPVLRLQQGAVRPFQQHWKQRASVKEWQSRCQVLQKAIDELEAQVIALRSATIFADQTHELIEYQKRFTNTYQRLVHIMLVQRVGGAHCMWIDAGSLHGITSDMIAIYKNCLLGRVVAVYPYYSKVQLISDASCNIAVHCAENKASGIYQGTGESGYALMNHVSHLDTLIKDDMVLSSGQGLVFPAGFAVGTVETWELDGVHYNIRLHLMCDVDALSHCYICVNRPVESI